MRKRTLLNYIVVNTEFKTAVMTGKLIMSKTKAELFVVSMFLAGLSGCGGGGGSTPPVISTLSFPLQSAYNADVVSGWTKSFTISGYCSGSGTRTLSTPLTSTTFESAAALAGVDSYSFSYTNCSPASGTASTTYYWNSSYVPIGENGVNGYGVALTAPAIPASVRVGDAGTIGTISLYTDSTKATSNGRKDISYVIEPETATTAIVNEIVRRYNAAGVLVLTTEVRARIAETGALIPLSVTNTNSANISVVWTYH